ncbi:MAG: ACT domain-containing protein [Bacteroidales bacterium]|nr:ACT domain-containing protein [Bacteroidales bacterium]
MIVKSFVLKQQSVGKIASLIDAQTVAVVRPQRKIEALFREAIRKTLQEKKQADDELAQIQAYFLEMSDNTVYHQAVMDTVEAVATYLREGMYVQTSPFAVEDYVMAKCARLCAQAVNTGAKASFIDGTEIMVCRTDHHGVQHFDWQASRREIKARCESAPWPIVISGGYGRLDTGYIVRVGKDGAHLMATLIAEVLKAASIEFHIEDKGVDGISAMTYEEAAHYCASAHAPFSSSAIWPAKNAGIPILVKDIADDSFPGTLISTGSSHGTAVLTDKDLSLITVYGTGLLGRVGMSGAIFSCLAKAGINVRFIAQTCSEYSISFAVKTEDEENAQEAIRGLFKDNPLLPLDDVVVANQAVGIVTVFGSKMRNTPGTSAAVYGKMGQAGINIIASAQGGEELSISLVVSAEDVDEAYLRLGSM